MIHFATQHMIENVTQIVLIISHLLKKNISDFHTAAAAWTLHTHCWDSMYSIVEDGWWYQAICMVDDWEQFIGQVSDCWQFTWNSHWGMTMRHMEIPQGTMTAISSWDCMTQFVVLFEGISKRNNPRMILFIFNRWNVYIQFFLSTQTCASMLLTMQLVASSEDIRG